MCRISLHLEMMFHIWSFSSLLIVLCILLSIAAIAQDCERSKHKGPEGDPRYCCVVECPKGTESLGCVDGHQYANCSACRPGFHKADSHLSNLVEKCTEDYHCNDCQICHPKKDATSDVTWSCNLTAGCYSPSGKTLNPDDCMIKICPVNTELNYLGECVHCAEGLSKPAAGIGRCTAIPNTTIAVYGSNGSTTLQPSFTSDSHLSEFYNYAVNVSVSPDAVPPGNASSNKLWILGLILGIAVITIASVVGFIYNRKFRRCCRLFSLRNPGVPSRSKSYT